MPKPYSPRCSNHFTPMCYGPTPGARSEVFLLEAGSACSRRPRRPLMVVGSLLLFAQSLLDKYHQVISKLDLVQQVRDPKARAMAGSLPNALDPLPFLVCAVYLPEAAPVLDST